MAVSTHFERLTARVADSAPNEYAPTIIPKEKYARIVEGRNRFFLYTIGAAAAFLGATAIPSALINRSVRRMYKAHCRGKVLDLSPKLYDESDVALYELSKAVVVEFLVEKRVVDDGHYRIDESLSETDREERRRAMTLDFMTRNDHHWVGSSVSFRVVEREATQKPEFCKYDCVVIRDELMNWNTAKAKELFNSAAEYMKDDGSFLVMDYGKPRSPRLSSFLEWFNRKTNSSMSLSHDYSLWAKESSLYNVVEADRTFLGMYYTLCLRKKPKPSAQSQSANPIS